MSRAELTLPIVYRNHLSQLRPILSTDIVTSGFYSRQCRPQSRCTSELGSVIFIEAHRIFSIWRPDKLSP